MPRLALIVEPGATPSSVTLTLDMIGIAQRYPEGAACRFDVFSQHGGPVSLSSRVAVDTEALPDRLDGYAAVIVPGFFAEDLPALVQSLATHWPPVIARLRALPAETLVAASCYGTFVLGESGLLDGGDATTTWWLADAFRLRYPAVRLDAGPAVVDNGRCLTAGAMTAHADLCLQVLRRLFGAALARAVASIMLIDGLRVSQRPFMSVRRQFDDRLVQQAADWLARHAATAVTAQALAEALHVSYRTLHRRFRAAVGMPPLAYLQELRVEQAKALLEATSKGFDEIVAAVGYSDAPAFRRLFQRQVGLSPAQYRAWWRRAE
ncbi:helix-turn-helix domain-containing protein [uncultured Propionivibrio sp.]|uniref:GlxA family transcriptional regulator n=1 Tax=uncultured Propionivibrio sp. TaxID=426737 RepID=UPI0029BFF428|nr:helix-turn-helix domain-containing protein [uncultured Propionivibrio sp.]